MTERGWVRVALSWSFCACGFVVFVLNGAWSSSVGETTTNRSASLVANETSIDILGIVEGRVTFVGEVPKARIADDGGQFRPVLEVDRKTRGLRYVVAYLVPLKSPDEAAIPPLPPDAESIIIDQKDHTFVPHLVALRAGQSVKFTNGDPANHNVRATSWQEKNQFNIFTGSGGQYQHRFQADEKVRPVQLGCDIHPWMRAWVYVFPHPYFAVTDEQGKFRIVAVAVGEYQLILSQPDVPWKHERRVVITPQKTATIELELKRSELKD